MPRWSLLVPAIAALAAALSIAASSGERPAAPAAARGPLLGVFEQRGRLQLARLDPVTLAPRGAARLDVGRPGCAPRAGGEACWAIPPWSLSPGGSRLAIARNGRDSARALRLVDVAGPRALTSVALRGGPVGLVAWLGRRQLLVLQELCCQEWQSVAWVDADSGRLLARRMLQGSVLRVARTPSALVALTARPDAIGPPSLEIAGADGTVRVVLLARVRAGVRVEDAHNRIETHVPGLAVDSSGRRAFVVAPGLVAQVDLGTLAVSYHPLRRAISLLERVRGWLDPQADAKEGSGPTRSAEWLGDGRLAVTGADESPGRVRPAGLGLIDTRDWTVRTIEPSASDVRVADGLLLVTGGAPPLGLAAYGFDGSLRFRLLAGRQAWVSQVHAGRAYVGVGGSESVRVVDLATGAVVGRRAVPPWLVAGSSSWWEP